VGDHAPPNITSARVDRVPLLIWSKADTSD
jgi:hypothetical protein